MRIMFVLICIQCLSTHSLLRHFIVSHSYKPYKRYN